MHKLIKMYPAMCVVAERDYATTRIPSWPRRRLGLAEASLKSALTRFALFAKVGAPDEWYSTADDRLLTRREHLYRVPQCRLICPCIYLKHLWHQSCWSYGS